MNVVNNQKNLQQLYFLFSSVAFALIGVLLFATGGLLSVFRYDFFWGLRSLLNVLSYFVVALGLLIKKRPVIQTGCGLRIIYCIIVFLSGGFYSWNILSLLFWLFLLLITFFPQKASLPVAFASVVLQIARAAVSFSSHTHFLSYLQLILLIAGAILMGLAFSSKLPVSTEKKPVSPPATQPIASDDTAEKLMKLKTLLDDGIITQEEFEEKKKQMLGL